MRHLFISLAALYFLTGNLQAATGERSDDTLVLTFPLTVLLAVWVGYEIKQKIAAYKAKRKAATLGPDSLESHEGSPE